MSALTDATVDLDFLDLDDVRISVISAPGCSPSVRVYCGHDVTFRASNLDKLRGLVDRLMDADRDLSIAQVQHADRRSMSHDIEGMPFLDNDDTSSLMQQTKYLAEQRARTQAGRAEEEARAQESVDPVTEAEWRDAS